MPPCGCAGSQPSTPLTCQRHLKVRLSARRRPEAVAVQGSECGDGMASGRAAHCRARQAEAQAAVREAGVYTGRLIHSCRIRLLTTSEPTRAPAAAALRPRGEGTYWNVVLTGLGGWLPLAYRAERASACGPDPGPLMQSGPIQKRQVEIAQARLPVTLSAYCACFRGQLAPQGHATADIRLPPRYGYELDLREK